MNSAAEKTSSTSPPAVTRADAPFFGRKGGGDFFGPAPGGAAVQAKMSVSQPGDPFEQEADKMSERVMRATADSSDKILRQSAETPQKAEVIHRFKREEEGPHHQSLTNLGEVQRRETTGGVPEIDSPLESGIKAQATAGQPLQSDLRREMEAHFGADFSTVRIHTGPEASALNTQLKARAFTYKNHIFFSRDQFQPDSRDGKQLLAHELTHTIQQGQAIRRKPPPERPEDTLHRATKPPVPEAITSSEVVDLSSGTFAPSEKVQSEIEAQGHKGLEVRIIVKGLTDEGRIKVRVDRKKNFDSIGRGSMPVKAPWADQLGGLHLNIRLAQSEIKDGFASVKASGGGTHDWVRSLQKSTEVLGGLGLKVENLPKPVNKFEGGKLTLGLTNLKVEIGGFLDAAFNFTVENAAKPVVEASAEINVKGIVKGQLKLDNTKEKLAGEISLGIEYKSFAGNALIKYNTDGTVDIGGKASYNADKLSGTIEFVSSDLETANNFARDAIKAAGGQEMVQEAPPPAPVPTPKPGAKKRGLAATGQLAFHLTEWFAGAVFVVVDAKGDVTVIGKIAPPAEIELMKQRNWDIEFFKLEAKAYYGLPVVGNINVFANVSLRGIASLGPAKIYNIEILGTYSTDPEIQKMIQISGSINMSAYAGIRLRAEGGAGIEILDHDIKFGVGISVDVGVKAYVDARPTIGYRDPGVFYISGTLDMLAQPVLGLGGDFFIALDTPWWSPLSDDRWTWPLFTKEWLLGDPLGISAEMKEYVLGSGKVPEIELKKPEFDSSKFMSKMVDNDLPGKSGKAGAGKGSFKEDGSVKKPEIPPKKPAPKQPEGKVPKKEPTPKAGKSAKPDPKGAKEKDSAKIMQNASKLLAALKGKGPFDRAELDQELGKMKARVPGIDFDVQVKGEKWQVRPKAGRNVGKGVEVAAKDKGAEDAPPNWSFAQTTFQEDDITHSICIEGGDEPRLIVRSDPKAAEAFLDWYLEKKTKAFEERHEVRIRTTRNDITKARNLARNIARLKKKRAAWKEKQQELLKTNQRIGEGLSAIVGRDPSLKNKVEKYHLEGLTGTYGSMPKPVGDDFTADHQPQAAILVALAKFEYFSKDGAAQERAEGRARAGFAINLHKIRHVAGATYGTKGKETKESFLQRVKPQVKDKPAAEQRRAVIRLVRAELNRDVTKIKDVVTAKYDEPLWKDVLLLETDDKASKDLVHEIRVRIVSGEDQIANQDLDLD